MVNSLPTCYPPAITRTYDLLMEATPMDRSTTRPEKLYAVHLPSAGCWMAISSEGVARALEETYEVIRFTESRGGRESATQQALRAFVGFAEERLEGLVELIVDPTMEDGELDQERASRLLGRTVETTETAEEIKAEAAQRAQSLARDLATRLSPENSSGVRKEGEENCQCQHQPGKRRCQGCPKARMKLDIGGGGDPDGMNDAIYAAEQAENSSGVEEGLREQLCRVIREFEGKAQEDDQRAGLMAPHTVERTITTASVDTLRRVVERLNPLASTQPVSPQPDPTTRPSGEDVEWPTIKLARRLVDHCGDGRPVPQTHLLGTHESEEWYRQNGWRVETYVPATTRLSEGTRDA